MDTSTSTLQTGPFPVEGMSGYFLLLPCSVEIHMAFNANSIDPDQMLRSALLWDARHKLIKSPGSNSRSHKF